MSKDGSTSRAVISATEARTFRTFLLMEALAAREIGRRIAQARLEAGLTQQELADVVDVTARTVQAWEAGDNIPFRKLRLLAPALNRETRWLLHGDEVVVMDEEDVPAVLAEIRDLLARIEQRLGDRPPPPADGEPQ